MFWPKGNADIGLQGKVTLQAPPTDGKQSGWVAAATPRGLALVNLHSGAVNTLPKAGKGDAARPVSTGGCVFAAWAQRAENYVGACDANGKGATYSSLESIDPTSQLVFRTNHRLVVLNDVINGNVWNPQDSAKVIKIQWNKVETKESKQQERNNDSASNQRHFSKSCSSQSGQIRAQEDAFGARTGSQQILDVLRNDEQTDCSVLHIDSVSAPDGANVSVFPVYDGRYLQLDASAAGAGEVTFSYEISDGRGQTASANVSLNLTDGEDRAPQQTDVPRKSTSNRGFLHCQCVGKLLRPRRGPADLGFGVAAEHRSGDCLHASRRPTCVQRRFRVLRTRGHRSHRVGREADRYGNDLFLGETGEHARRRD